jgi:gluconolactonase
MIWRYHDNDGLSKFLKCSGLVGPGDTPDNIADFIEAGSNGLDWGWGGDGDLLICQHGKRRIARINVNDVEDGEIDPSLVSVLVDSYNGTMLNSPNDLVLDGDTLYFTDPPFGLQFFSADDAIANAFGSVTQDGIGVYTIVGDPAGDMVEPVRIIDYGKPDPWQAPNGVAINRNGDVVLAITDFSDPHFDVIHINGTDNQAARTRLESEYRIEGENSDFPALNDGVTYSPELDVIFGSGPGGVYMYNGTTFDLLGFLRLDDLTSNNVVGGGYLWMTVNTRLMRIPLASSSEGTSSAMRFTSFGIMGAVVFSATMTLLVHFAF